MLNIKKKSKIIMLINKINKNAWENNEYVAKKNNREKEE